MSAERLVLVGGSGHASDVLQAIEALNDVRPTYQVVGILDDSDIDPRRFEGRGLSQIGSVSDIRSLDAMYVLCVGWPWTRRLLVERIGDQGHPASPIVHPRSEVGRGVELGPGTVVLGNSHLSPGVRLGSHSLVSYLASAGHDATFGDYCTLLPHAAVSGQVSGGQGVLVGAGAVLREGVTIGDEAVIGAGAVVTRDVGPGMTVVGIPARPLE